MRPNVHQIGNLSPFQAPAFLAPFPENPRKIERMPTAHFWHPFPIITGAVIIPSPAQQSGKPY
jgi:hypothetical protein